MGLTLIDDEAGARALADHLNGDARRRPVALVTTPAGRQAPWVDVDELVEAFGDAVEVYQLPTGSFTRALSDRLPAGTQAYGGASRVYPVGHAWIRDLRESPLRFSFDSATGEESTRQLVADGLRMALACGSLVLAAARPTSRRAAGTVKGVVSTRALVELEDRTLATIDEQLTVPGVPLERVVSRGLRVEGVYDPASRRLDVQPSVRPSSVALQELAIGEVVPALVETVEAGTAHLTVYPGVGATVTVDEVTDNALDDLRGLLSRDEVVAARIVGLGPDWRLSLLDVDDDEPVRVAPALLDGGPPWLDPPADDPWHAPGSDSSDGIGPDALPPEAAPATDGVPTQPAQVQTTSAPPPSLGGPTPSTAPARPRPTPRLFDRRRRDDAQSESATLHPSPEAPAPAPPVPTPPASAPPAATTPVPGRPPRQDATPSPKPERQSRAAQALHDTIAGLKADVTRARAELAAMTTQQAITEDRLDQTTRERNRLEHQNRQLRTQARKKSRPSPEHGHSYDDAFADPEEQWRFDVLLAWTRRVSASEKGEMPLPEFRIGPRFIESLDAMQGVSREKLASVTVDVLIGRAAAMAGRELHQLRTGPGGDDPARTREDGATAWRVAVQRNTPSARRLHFWSCPDGVVELSRVVVHDDMSP